MIEEIKERARQEKKRIILPESFDKRVLKATAKILEEDFAIPILIGEENKIKELAQKENIDLRKVEIINPKTYKEKDALIDAFYELRKEKKITKEEAQKQIIENYLYFGNMLVKMGYADGLVSGAVVSSSDTLRPALQIIKTKKGTKTASCFFLIETKEKNLGINGTLLYADCGMNQNPTAEELVEIAKESANSMKLLLNTNDAKIAFLSHSTASSSICKDQEKMKKATKLFQETYPEIDADGEMQFDTAIIKEIATQKMPHSKVAGNTNILIFPDLDAGNIAYKITERLAHAHAYGPITQGLNKPINDLSRGCSTEDIVGVVAITAVQGKVIE